MGQVYKDVLERKLHEFRDVPLRAYVNPDGVDPHYLSHLEETLRSVGAVFVRSRDEANFVFDGNCEPCERTGQVVAFFKNGQLPFIGAAA
jgi:hypothetical protein